jgi:chromate transport protein ChrA
MSSFFRKYFTLERGLTVGGVLLALGGILGVTTLVLIYKFANNLPYVNILYTQLAIASIFIVMIGIQFIFTSFYMSFLDLEKTLE